MYRGAVDWDEIEEQFFNHDLYLSADIRFIPRLLQGFLSFLEFEELPPDSAFHFRVSHTRLYSYESEDGPVTPWLQLEGFLSKFKELLKNLGHVVIEQSEITPGYQVWLWCFVLNENGEVDIQTAWFL